jgi:hypothetical protein
MLVLPHSPLNHRPLVVVEPITIADFPVAQDKVLAEEQVVLAETVM